MKFSRILKTIFLVDFITGLFLAIKESFKLEAKRVWVHTCSLDHKDALENYKSRGMKIFKSETISINPF